MISSHTNGEGKASRGALRERATTFLTAAPLPLWLGLLAMALASPALFIGLHLDDYVHKYLFLGLPGSADLARSYVSPYAIANGDPALNHWLVEEGFAPWWTYDRLLLSFFRPLSALTHRLDYALWPESPVAMHAHSLLWFGAVIAVATIVYRSILGRTTVAGAAAFLYAVDHTHGLPVGWIANRNALPAVLFGLLALYAYDRGRRGSVRATLLGPASFLVGLLGGEMTLGVWAYLFAHAVCLDERSVRSRSFALAPYAVITVVWRLIYNHLGYGARGSGLYLDPVHEPLAFVAALARRIPLLALGEIGLPPAEAYYFVSDGLRPLIFASAVVAIAATVVVVLPLVRRDPVARFFALGAALSLPPVCTAYPHNRLLYFVGFGVMGILAILVRDAFARADWLPLQPLWHVVAQPYLAASIFVHGLLSPFLLPIEACSVMTTSSITTRAIPSALSALSSPSEQLIVVSAPEYFSVNLIPFVVRLNHEPEPARIRMLSIGPVPLTVRRTSPRQLEVDYEGGLLAAPLSQLYRSARLAMTPGVRVELRGLSIELLSVTPDGRPSSARFTFAEELESGLYRFVEWRGDHYVPFVPPMPGSAARRVRAAHMPFEVGEPAD
ncbi:MAG TPA: hypothetical protein VF395_06685 [Polyangiaceae bacterium]